jgi:hypothetical protein
MVIFPEKLVLSAEDLGRILGRSGNSVRIAACRRQIPFRKQGRKLLFYWPDIKEWLETLPGVTVEEVLKHADLS